MNLFVYQPRQITKYGPGTPDILLIYSVLIINKLEGEARKLPAGPVFTSIWQKHKALIVSKL